MMSLIRNIFLIMLLSLCPLMQTVKAGLIVETADRALIKSIYEPGFRSSYADQNNSSAPLPQDVRDPNSYNYNYDYEKDPNRIKSATPQIDYKGVADKLIPDNTENNIRLVDLNGYTTSIAVTQGQFVAVRLDEDDMSKWNFENRSNVLEFVKSEKRGSIIIMLYRATRIGTSRINFDKLNFENNEVKAVDSKVLEARVM